MNGRKMPSPALVIAVLALFVSLSGTAVAAGVVPLAKRALPRQAKQADNSKKLGGQTAGGDRGEGRADGRGRRVPRPGSSLSSRRRGRSAPSGPDEFVVVCDAGQKAVSGGFDDPSGYTHPWDNRPTADGAGWRIYLGTVVECTRSAKRHRLRRLRAVGLNDVQRGSRSQSSRPSCCAGGVGRSGAPGAGAPGPRSRSRVELRLGRADAVLRSHGADRVVARRRAHGRNWGASAGRGLGRLRADTVVGAGMGGILRRPAARARARHRHGSRRASGRSRRARRGKVRRLGCYGGGHARHSRASSSGGWRRRRSLRHEYGHHVAASRVESAMASGRLGAEALGVTGGHLHA